MWEGKGRPPAGSPVAEWAASQFGVVTRAQARAAGLTSESVAWRVASGRWTALGRGVYLTEPGRSGFGVTATTAFLALQGRDGLGRVALAGRTAAVAWGLDTRVPDVVELVVPHDRRVRPPDGTKVRRVAGFESSVDAVSYPWRTSLPVTVLDCAALGDADHALAVVARAVQKRRVGVGRLLAELGRRRGHPHGALLLEALGDVADGAESAAELRYVRDVERAHGLPVGGRQVAGRSGPVRVHDTVYEDVGVVVEVDGRLGHEQWDDRVRDGRRDRRAAGEGRFTSRVFWSDLLAPCRTAADIAAVLTARGWSGHPRPCRRAACDVRSMGAPSGS